MDINLQIRDMGKIEQIANKAPGVLFKNMRLAMEVSCRDVQREARSVHLFRTRTGILEKAIDTQVTVNAETGIEGTIFIDDNVAPYGKFVHTGTKPHIIKPKNKNALRWAMTNSVGFRFAQLVHHPGTKADEFVFKALDAKENDIYQTFEKYRDRAIKEAGFE